jgi:hypothetical protein
MCMTFPPSVRPIVSKHSSMLSQVMSLSSEKSTCDRSVYRTVGVYPRDMNSAVAAPEDPPTHLLTPLSSRRLCSTSRPPTMVKPVVPVPGSTTSRIERRCDERCVFTVVCEVGGDGDAVHEGAACGLRVTPEDGEGGFWHMICVWSGHNTDGGHVSAGQRGGGKNVACCLKVSDLRNPHITIWRMVVYATSSYMAHPCCLLFACLLLFARVVCALPISILHQ